MAVKPEPVPTKAPRKKITLERTIRVMVVITGVKSRHMFGPSREKKKGGLGLDFIK